MDELPFLNCDDKSQASNVFINARQVDPKSSFGDIIGYSGMVDREMALQLKKCVSDGIIAYNYTEEAFEILKTKNTSKIRQLFEGEIKISVIFKKN